MKRPSLRLNLIKSLVPPLAAVILMIGIFSVWSIYHEVDEVYDATLVQFAKTLSRTAINAPVKKENDHLAHKYERNISYRIFHHEKLLAQSADGVAFDGLEPVPGFSSQRAEGINWRFFTLIDEESGYTVVVAEKQSIRHELTLQLLSSLVFPGVLFVIVVFAVIWWGVTRGLKRLVSLSEEMDRREANDLTPISDPAIPLEINPLLEAINRLFVRITESFTREREFADNAAHELRTPLAAIKTQVQVIMKTEKLTTEGRQGFGNLLAAIDRAADMTESLLSFARLQADTGRKERVQLCQLVRTEAAAFEKQAQMKNISLTIYCDEGVFIEGIPLALAILVRNIIQNAVKFTPDNGQVKVTVKKSDGKAILAVSDTGAGIPDAFKQKVFNRFFRINKSAKTGSGLGLAMVKWIADLHGADIRLEDNKPHGLVIEAVFKCKDTLPE